MSLRSTAGDPGPHELLMAIPPNDREHCLVASLDASRKGGSSEDYDPTSPIRCYWAIDSQTGEILTEYDVYRKLMKGNSDAPKA